MFTDREIDVLGQIGIFFLNENGGCYHKTEQFIRNIGIAEIMLIGNKLTLTVKRPGLLIGRRGMTFDKLKDHLGLEIHLIEVKEDILDYLIPQDYSQEF